MRPQNTIQDATELLGEYPALLRRLGPGDDVSVPAPASLWHAPLRTVPELSAFIRRYHAEILAPLELPAIARAAEHTRRNEGRELIALDQSLDREAALRDFADASRRVGRGQLRRLRPLRDHRVLQKYLAASDDGLVRPWHTVVYGVTLGLYAIPLRQGLMGYVERTLGAWVELVRDARRLPALECSGLLEALLPETRVVVEAALVLRSEEFAGRAGAALTPCFRAGFHSP